ncbi:hypothetical protein WS75_19445 [Burkholderia sp. FL-7-2-10-S1-D7]|nr:hypothetical protein WS75_19445 [Burkholderia sp. FL-7-2-10-S1-D7]
MIMDDGGLQKLRETAVKSACLLEGRVGWRHAGVGKQDRRRGRLRRTHYVYEPGSFVPAAQAVREEAVELLDQPEYGDYYRQDEDPLWLPPPPAPAINCLAWYQCDHLGTAQELTDEHSEIAWSAEYRAWGVAQKAIRKTSGKAPIANPIRFQGQYHDHETGLHYNRYRYYDPHGASPRISPIRYRDFPY